MTQTKFLGDIKVVAYWQDTARSFNAFAGYYHCSVVQRRVFEENVFYETLVDVGINGVSGFHDIIEWGTAFDDDQCTDFCLRHTHTGQYNGHNHLASSLAVLLIPTLAEEPAELFDALMCTKRIEKTTDFFLKKHNQGLRVAFQVPGSRKAIQEQTPSHR